MDAPEPAHEVDGGGPKAHPQEQGVPLALFVCLLFILDL